MSWSEGRNAVNILENDSKKKKVIEGVRGVNELLAKFSRDEDLKSDLKLAEVNDAILHWTNVKRKSPEEAARFEDNYRVISVLQKIQQLQSVCQQLNTDKRR